MARYWDDFEPEPEEGAGGDAQADDRLVVVFAPGLWPFRSPLDAPAWYLAEGVARALSEVPGLLAYATPRALVEPSAEPARPGAPALRVLRSLPPIPLLRAEAAALGAPLALTGRVLSDRQGYELWLNLVDGPSGDLVWTGHATAEATDVLWRLTWLLRKLVSAQQLAPETLTVHTIAGTGSWPAFVAWSRARERLERWEGAASEVAEILEAAARAHALDPAFAAAEALLANHGPALVEALEDLAGCDAARDALELAADRPAAVALRRAVHERYLALAERGGQTYIRRASADDTA